MNLALTSHGLKDALMSWGSKWLTHPRYCDWCRAQLTAADLSEYVDWCLTLREAWPSNAKRLPADRVFCLTCAVGAIHELHGGPKYAPAEEESCPF